MASLRSFVSILFGVLISSCLASSEADSLSRNYPYNTLCTDKKCASSPVALPTAERVCAAPKNWYAWVGDYPTVWTQRPWCVDSVYATEYSAHTTYCTFVNRDFADGRGIAMFVSVHSAEHISGQEVFTNDSHIRGFNDLESGPFSPPAYEQRYVPGKGIGLVASRAIVRGERIMQESLPIVYDRDSMVNVYPEDRLPMHFHMVYSLPENTRDELLGLATQGNGDVVDDAIRTNAFGFYFEEELLSYILFTRISRFNHDCRPNSQYFFDMRSMVQFVHAIRDIVPGEEITITYINTEDDYQTRALRLMYSWGFRCSCSICRQPYDHIQASDRRLSKIKEIKAELDDWKKTKPRIEMSQLLTSLYEQERLSAPAGLQHATYAYSATGDEANTIHYASLAVELLTLIMGSENDQTLDMLALMVDPKSHHSWNFWTQADQLRKSNETKAEG